MENKDMELRGDLLDEYKAIQAAEEPVSYTHLTLPTIYSV